MLPDFVKDSYKQYKDDTDRFATWLVNTAKKCGYEPELPAAWPAGKANTGKKSSRSRAAKSTNYLVTIKEFSRLGDAVAKSSIKAPSSILALAKRAIMLRKEVTSWFLGKASTSSAQRHAHFIRVMEEIYDALTWEPVGDRNSSKHSKGSKNSYGDDVNETTEHAWMNRFASLNVEDIEDSQETVTKQGEMIKVTVAEEDATDDDEDGLSHGIFRVICLFHDLSNWRKFISQTWTEYGSLKIDLMTASVVTDTALQLARDLIQEVLDDLPTEIPKDVQELQTLLYSLAAINRGMLDASPSMHLGLTFNENLADVVDWCYAGIGSLLLSFLPVIQEDNRNKMSLTEKFHEDKILIFELLPEFCMINIGKLPFPVQDEITAGFVDFVQNRKPSLWLYFAAQVMLDAHHATRSCQLTGFSDLRMCGLRIARTIDDYWKLAATHSKPAFWSDVGDEEIRHIRRIISDYIETDALLVLRRMLQEEHRHLVKHSTSHLLFSRNPLLCGLFMFHLNLRMQTIGQGLVNQWYDVQQLAFLYNLVQKSAEHDLDWPDIELFIKIHGESQIFIGDRPKDASQSINRLEIATGISSATRFASSPRRPRQQGHTPDGKSRLLEPTTKAANLFRIRYLEYISRRGTQNLQSAELRKFLDELSNDRAKTKSKGSKGSKGAELDPAHAGLQDLLGHKWRNTHNVGTLQLLALLKEKLWEEEPAITFNYFAMHKVSIEILRLIKAREHHKFVQYFTPAYMPDDTYISNLVILVHYVARGSAQSAAQMGLGKRSGNQIVSRIVRSCGDVMAAYLAKNGSVVSKEMRIFCKNKSQLSEDTGSTGEKKNVKKEYLYWFALEEVLGPKEMESLKTGIPIA